MAAFREGKFARKMKGRFQSTAVKSRTENVLDSAKKSLDDAKVSFQSESYISQTSLVTYFFNFTFRVTIM